MSDDTDTCGHETANGTPCQHPATEGDSCWIDAHGGDTSVGRDFSIDESDHEAILDAARDGLSKAGCARTAGVSRPELNRYLESDDHEDFRSAFARARARGERRLVAGPLVDREDEPDMDGQHARFLLSTSFDYVKTEKTELEHSGEVTHDTPAEFVTYEQDTDDE